MKEINILGTLYTVEKLEEKDDCMKEMIAVGYTDRTTKRISYLKEKEGITQVDNPIKIENITLRHEIIHAFLFESGIDINMQFHNEEMVDWLAVQFPKLYKIFRELNCKE